MSEIGRLCTQRAKEQPERFFAVPKDVIGEVMLTRGEKLATLERWRLRILDHQRGRISRTKARGEQVEILYEIAEAKKLLELQYEGAREFQIGEK
jgi:hypothetical protein